VVRRLPGRLIMRVTESDLQLGCVHLLFPAAFPASLLCLRRPERRIAVRLIDSEAGARRTAFLVAGVSVNLAALAVFKYAGFIVRNINELTCADLPAIDIHLPLGISFFIFQLISYLVDIGRSNIAADRGFIRFATYVLMFPHLIAGPIVRLPVLTRAAWIPNCLVHDGSP
jgi:hypothetical protein